MPIYLITPLANNSAQLTVAIVAAIPETDRHELQSHAGWLVASKGTAVEVSNVIGVTGQAEGQPAMLGSAMVTTVSSYYGRGPASMWDWLKTRFESGA